MAAVVSTVGGSADGAYHKLGMKSRNPNPGGDSEKNIG